MILKALFKNYYLENFDNNMNNNTQIYLILKDYYVKYLRKTITFLPLNKKNHFHSTLVIT